MATKFKNSVEIDGYLSISSGNWIQVPDGTTAQRPGSPAVGMFRYNTTTDKFEGYLCPDCQLVTCEVCNQDTIEYEMTEGGTIICDDCLHKDTQ